MSSAYQRTSGRWYLRYKDEGGKWRGKASSACTAEEARALAAAVEAKGERMRLGLVDEEDAAAKALAALVPTLLDEVERLENERRQVLEKRKVHRERTKAALAARRRRGEPCGTLPYGYVVGPDRLHLVPDEKEQAVIRDVRALRTAGMSFREIVRECESRGVVSRAGRPFGLTSIVRIVEPVTPCTPDCIALGYHWPSNAGVVSFISLTATEQEKSQ